MRLAHAFFIVALTAVLNHPIIAGAKECLKAIQEHDSLLEKIDTLAQQTLELHERIIDRLPFPSGVTAITIISAVPENDSPSIVSPTSFSVL